MAKVERILIVGGGIAGLTAAIALRQRGFSPELIEREPAWRAVGAGIALQPNAMRLLRALGVGTAVERAGAPLRRFKYCTSQGEILAEIDLVELWKDVGRGVGVERTKLQEALLGELKGAQCRLGAWITIVGAEERLRFGSLQRRAKRGLRSDHWRGRNRFERPFVGDERPAPRAIPDRWGGAAWRRSVRTPRTKCSSGSATDAFSASFRSAINIPTASATSMSRNDARTRRWGD